MKNKIVKLKDSIVRVLDEVDDKYLIIDCQTKTMCLWINKKVVDSQINVWYRCSW